jgi:hypothetical protein
LLGVSMSDFLPSELNYFLRKFFIAFVLSQYSTTT